MERKRPDALPRHRIDAPVLSIVTIVDVLVHRVALLLEDGNREGRRKLVLKHFLDCEPHRRAGLLTLPPVKDEFFLLQSLQEVAGCFLHRLFFFLGELHVGSREEIENRQFLLRQAFRDCALILLV